MRAGVKAGLSWHGIYFAFTLSFVNLIFYQRPHSHFSVPILIKRDFPANIVHTIVLHNRCCWVSCSPSVGLNPTYQAVGNGRYPGLRLSVAEISLQGTTRNTHGLVGRAHPTCLLTITFCQSIYQYPSPISPENDKKLEKLITKMVKELPLSNV